MGLVSLKSAWDAVENPDLSTWEKFTSISMSLSMGLPMLMSGFSGLSKLFGPIAAAIGTMSWSIDKNTKSIINNYLANNNLNKGLKIANIQRLLIGKGIDKDTAKTIANTIAKEGLNKALIEQIALLLGVKASTVALIGSMAILAGVIAVIVAIIDAVTISQKEANKNINEATEAYEGEKQKLDELKNSLEEVNQKIDELNKKDVLSITDENDLIRLKQ